MNDHDDSDENAPRRVADDASVGVEQGQDAKDEVFGAFLEELEIADNSNLVVQRFSAAYPQWAGEFQEEVGLTRLFEGIHAPRMIHSPDQFPDFRIIRWIATGGMGVLYEAEQLALGRRVALKVHHGRSSEASRDRFEREQRVLARLHQSHIVPIHAAGQSGPWQYFAMAFIDGASLHQVVGAAIRRVLASPAQPLPAIADLVRDPRDPTSDPKSPTGSLVAAFASGTQPVRLTNDYLRSVASILADAAEALDHAHRAQVTHRDVKPSNILVDRSGACFVIDFGLAACRDDDSTPVDGAAEPARNGGPPATRGIFGTPEYMPPERFAESHLAMTPASDIWGLGVILYELLTLRRAFRGTTVDEIRRRIQDEEPTPIERLATNVPPDLAAICRLAMRRRAADRYAHAADFAADLRRWLRGEPTTARPARALRATAMWAARNKRWSAALAALLVLSIAAVSLQIAVIRTAAQRDHDRATLAESRADAEQRKAALERRESLIQEAQRLQFVDRSDGWSTKSLAMLKEAGDIRADDRVRDLVINALSGIDLRLAKRFPRPGSSVAFDATGSRLLMGGHNEPERKPGGPPGAAQGDAVLWDARADLEQPSGRAGAGPVAFAADGTPCQLTFDDKGRLVLWDVARRTALRQFSEGPARLIALSPTCRHVAMSLAMSHSAESRTLVWHAASGDVVANIAGSAEVCAFSPDDRWIALTRTGVSGADHEVSVHSLPDNKLLATIPLGPVAPRSLAFGGGKDSPLLAVGDAGGSIGIFNWASRTPVNFCRGSVRDVFALAFNADGALLVSAGREEGRLWDVASGRLLLRFRDPHGMDFATGVAFSPDGRQLAVSTRGIFYPPSVSVWDVLADRGVRCLVGLPGAVEKLAISPDGTRVAALAQSWNIAVWDALSGRRLASWPAPPGAYADNAALAFSPDGARLAYSVSQVDRGHARLWDTETGAEVRRWTLPPGLQNQFAWSETGSLVHFQVEANGADLPLMNRPWKLHPRVGRVRDLDADPAKVLFEIDDFPRHVYHTIVTPDHRRVLIDGVGGEETERRWVKAFDLGSGKRLWSLDSPRTDHSSLLVLDPSGKFLCVTLANNQTSTILSVADGAALSHSKIDAFPNAIFGNGLMRVRVLNEGQIGGFLFDESDTHPIANVALETPVSSVRFDSSGTHLFWGGRDGVVRICDLGTIRKLSSFASR